MAENVDRRVWTMFEEDFLVNWFYQGAKIWEPQGTRAVLNDVVRFHNMCRQMNPLMQNVSQEDVVRKLQDFKEQYESFRWFINRRGIYFDYQNDVGQYGLDYIILIGSDEVQRDGLVRVRALRNYSKLRFLFQNGCLTRVDYPWLMAAAAGVEAAWLGEPFV